MTRTHTPGPWQAYHDSHGRFQLIADGLPLDPERDGAQPGEGAANAALIAAAPDLLAALRAIADADCRDVCGAAAQDLQAWAAAAIAKAEGGE